ncbi:MAG TPA: hypothetical protein VN937_28015, partial [Blastocatellia bacterium]|nr:hypothetical protein [Blastocatellia bacterium]
LARFNGLQVRLQARGGPRDWECDAKRECHDKRHFQTFAQAGRTSPVNVATLSRASITQA